MYRLLMIIALALPASHAAAQFKPSPYAATELDAAKNTCMLHSNPKPQSWMRRPELSDVKPDGWDPGFEACEQIWSDWKVQLDGARPVRERARDEGEAARASDLNAGKGGASMTSPVGDMDAVRDFSRRAGAARKPP